MTAPNAPSVRERALEICLPPEVGRGDDPDAPYPCAECLAAAAADAPPSAAAAPVAAMARAFSAYLDSTYPADLCTEARLWRRVTKVDEETGEVQQALRAYLGENPRKPRGPVEDLIKELADVAACALGALEHVTGNEGRSLALVEARLRYCCERAGLTPTGDPS